MAPAVPSGGAEKETPLIDKEHILFRPRAAGILACCLVTFHATTGVDARSSRVAQIPNGGENRCANCHVNPAGGGTLSSFGQMVEESFLTEPGSRGSVTWGPELAGLDADEDGFTNGEELGDPEGTWTSGDDPPGDPETVTNPADPESHPPEPEPTAVAVSTWGGIKGFLQQLR